MANTSIADGVLIRRYLEGNAAAFEILVNRHKDRIYGSVLNIVNDTYLAEDIFQETFIKIIHNIKKGSYNHEDKFLPWAIRSARNMAIDNLRRKKRMPNVVTSDGSDLFETLLIADKSQEDIRIEQEEHAELYRWIRLLPEEQREVLVLRSYADLSFKEIAAITDTNINTCIGRMHYALTNLRKLSEKNSVRIK
jgi:RNA polymerase sigma-70 factor (ECF subfamily)